MGKDQDAKDAETNDDVEDDWEEETVDEGTGDDMDELSEIGSEVGSEIDESEVRDGDLDMEDESTVEGEEMEVQGQGVIVSGPGTAIANGVTEGETDNTVGARLKQNSKTRRASEADRLVREQMDTTKISEKLRKRMEKEENKSNNKKRRELNEKKKMEKKKFDIVAVEDPTTPGKAGALSDEEEEEQVSDDEKAQAETLALGSKMVRKRVKTDLVNDSYNRYTNVDPELPTWFEVDQRTFNQRIPGLTKRTVNRYRSRLKEINDRPMKKIAEARARNKLKRVQRIERQAKKAQSVQKEDALSEKEKLRTIERLFKKRDKRTMNQERVYLVSKKSGATNARKGPRRGKIVHVDSRMKKEKMAVKRRMKKTGVHKIKPKLSRKPLAL